MKSNNSSNTYNPFSELVAEALSPVVELAAPVLEARDRVKALEGYGDRLVSSLMNPQGSNSQEPELIDEILVPSNKKSKKDKAKGIAKQAVISYLTGGAL